MAKFIANANDNGTGPTVMVYIGNDDPTRGDTRGMLGIGQAMAQKLGGHFIYLENQHVFERYSTRTIAEGLKMFFEEYAKPDILLSTFAYDIKTALRGVTGEKSPLDAVMRVGQYNELLSKEHLGEAALVSHHLTPEIFSAEGEKFKAAYPDVKHPLIGALITHASLISEQDVTKIVRKAGLEDQATIFLCGSRRTDSPALQKTVDMFNDQLSAQRVSDRIQVKVYDFNAVKDQGGYNPYVGLIDQADIILASGSSQSMVSEPLARGKPVTIFDFIEVSYGELIKDGFAYSFNAAAPDTRFVAGEIKPINVTDRVAEALVAQYKEKFALHSRPHGLRKDKSEAVVSLSQGKSGISRVMAGLFKKGMGS